ncbi:hypothetical protein [Dickeya dadantii]|uniref:hypothetical protein n=1 Tax=Dickeya dadantii TaxID=204038 RepID=UPI00345B471C
MNVKEESQRRGIRHFNHILLKNVPGNIPNGYKPAILLFLIINHLLFFLVNAFAAGWSPGLFSLQASPER